VQDVCINLCYRIITIAIKSKSDIAVPNRNQHYTIEITCHIGSHSATCHPAAVTFPPLPSAEADTQFSDPRG